MLLQLDYTNIIKLKNAFEVLNAHIIHIYEYF